MAFKNSLINTSKVKTEFIARNDNLKSLETIRKEVIQQCVDDIFKKFNIAVSGKMDLVEMNTLSIQSQSGWMYFRESYYVPEVEKYIIFQIYLYLSMSTNPTYSAVNFNLLLSDSIIKSSNQPASTNPISSVGVYANYSEENYSYNNDGTYWTVKIGMSFYLNEFYNSTINLFQLKNEISTDFRSSIAIIKTANTNFVGNRSNDSFILYSGAEGEIFYLQCLMLVNHEGTSQGGEILTLPVYLCRKANSDSLIIKEYELKDALQTTRNSCSAGAIYSIDGIDYFAVLNNLLLKME